MNCPRGEHGKQKSVISSLWWGHVCETLLDDGVLPRLAEAVKILANGSDVEDKLPAIYQRNEKLWAAYETLPITRKLRLRPGQQALLEQTYEDAFLG